MTTEQRAVPIADDGLSLRTQN